MANPPLSRGNTLVWYANFLANTFVNGIPSLTAQGALCVYAGIPLTNSIVAAANKLNNETAINFLSVKGALNKKAGTSNLSEAQAAYVLCGGTNP